MANGIAAVLVDPATDLPYRASGAVPGGNVNEGVTSTGLTSTQLLPANANRKRVVIQNQDSANPIFVRLGNAATAAAPSIRIAAGATFEVTGSSQAIFAIATGAAVATAVWEF